MKKLLVIAVGMTMLAASLFVFVAASPKGGPGPLEKGVFVDYPRGHDAAKPSRPGGGNGKGEVCEYKTASGGLKWSTLPVGYSVNLANAAGNVSDYQAGIEAAMQTWVDDLQSNFTASSQGLTTVVPGTQDWNNVVGWADISDQYPGAIAVTTYWYYPWTKSVVEADMIMNSALPWAQDTSVADPNSETGDVAAAYDVQNIATHEFGHFLVLADLYTSDTKETMYGYGALGELKKRSLECGDLAGIKKLYR